MYTYLKLSPRLRSLPAQAGANLARHALLLTGCALQLAVFSAPAWAQSRETSPGIFVCVDAKGRRITSDRPIPECLDRDQRELSSSGVTKRIVRPHPTADEQARDEALAQQEAAARTKEADAKRRDRALLARYPSQRHHDAEREKQLSLVDGAIAVIEQRGAELRKQQQSIQEEMEFYKGDPSKAPAWLKHRVADNSEQLASQKRLVADQMDEKKRVNARFDEDLVRLKQLLNATPTAR